VNSRSEAWRVVGEPRRQISKTVAYVKDPTKGSSQPVQVTTPTLPFTVNLQFSDTERAKTVKDNLRPFTLELTQKSASGSTSCPYTALNQPSSGPNVWLQVWGVIWYRGAKGPAPAGSAVRLVTIPGFILQTGDAAYEFCAAPSQDDTIGFTDQGEECGYLGLYLNDGSGNSPWKPEVKDAVFDGNSLRVPIRRTIRAEDPPLPVFPIRDSRQEKVKLGCCLATSADAQDYGSQWSRDPGALDVTNMTNILALMRDRDEDGTDQGGLDVCFWINRHTYPDEYEDLLTWLGQNPDMNQSPGSNAFDTDCSERIFNCPDHPYGGPSGFSHGHYSIKEWSALSSYTLLQLETAADPYPPPWLEQFNAQYPGHKPDVTEKSTGWSSDDWKKWWNTLDAFCQPCFSDLLGDPGTWSVEKWSDWVKTKLHFITWPNPKVDTSTKTKTGRVYGSPATTKGEPGIGPGGIGAWAYAVVNDRAFLNAGDDVARRIYTLAVKDGDLQLSEPGDANLMFPMPNGKLEAMGTTNSFSSPEDIVSGVTKIVEQVKSEKMLDWSDPKIYRLGICSHGDVGWLCVGVLQGSDADGTVYQDIGLRAAELGNPGAWSKKPNDGGGRLFEKLVDAMSPRIIVSLFACLTGQGMADRTQTSYAGFCYPPRNLRGQLGVDTGFAASLYQYLKKTLDGAEPVVWGHVVPGNSTNNGTLRCFADRYDDDAAEDQFPKEGGRDLYWLKNGSPPPWTTDPKGAMPSVPKLDDAAMRMMNYFSADSAPGHPDAVIDVSTSRPGSGGTLQQVIENLPVWKNPDPPGDLFPGPWTEAPPPPPPVGAVLKGKGVWTWHPSQVLAHVLGGDANGATKQTVDAICAVCDAAEDPSNPATLADLLTVARSLAGWRSPDDAVELLKQELASTLLGREVQILEAATGLLAQSSSDDASDAASDESQSAGDSRELADAQADAQAREKGIAGGEDGGDEDDQAAAQTGAAASEDARAETKKAAALAKSSLAAGGAGLESSSVVVETVLDPFVSLDTFVRAARAVVRAAAVLVARQLLRGGFSHLVVKVGNDDHPSEWQHAHREMGKAVQNVGLELWGWHYAYNAFSAAGGGKGKSMTGENDETAQRARHAYDQVQGLGLDGYIFDAEEEFNDVYDDHTPVATSLGRRHQVASLFVDFLKKGCGQPGDADYVPAGGIGVPIALSSYQIKGHESFPWMSFLADAVGQRTCDLVMPQIYAGSDDAIRGNLDTYWNIWWSNGSDPETWVDSPTAVWPNDPSMPLFVPTFGIGQFAGDTSSSIPDLIQASQDLELAAANVYAWDDALKNAAASWKPTVDAPWEEPGD
jgi:hypothetical protein